MPKITSQMLTVHHVSKILSLGVSTIWRKVKEGSFPAPIKIGGATRWHRKQIDAYIDELTADKNITNRIELL